MKKNLLYAGILVVLASFVLIFYSKYISPTKIATLNFPDFTVEKFIRSNDNKFIDIESLPLDDIEKLSGYDVVLVRVHGESLNASHLKAIKKAISAGTDVLCTEADNPEINSRTGKEQKYLSTLLDNGCVKNYRSLFNYLRAKIDKKKFFNKQYGEPVIIPDDYFFYPGGDNFFSSYEKYQAFYEKSGKYKSGAPRIALLAGNVNIQNSNSEHMEAVINSLERKGMNVYPLYSFGMKKISMLSAVHPDLIINRPHGRLVMGGGDAGTDLLKKLGVPVLAPVTVSDLYDNWVKSSQGMASGGLTSMSVVLPELDGDIVPFAIAAQFERNGKKIFDSIPGHTEKFCRLAVNFVNLQRKRNKDKHIAIYYYKGVGKACVNAADIEALTSLYNTLKYLKSVGYDLEGLPSSAEKLKKMIQEQGSVLGPYALGAYDRFVKNGNPALVDGNTFEHWEKKNLPEELIESVKAKYGDFPGKYMSVEKNGREYIAVARIRFGNVTILPQPMPSVGKDVNKLIHGVKGAPAYPYIASYLWTRESFKADAILHFGTHGSLEFIPGKQIALSGYDWTDALIGDVPNFYYYTIGNIGEGIIAKRRSYATLISHLTAPFMQSELYNELKILEGKIHRMETFEEGKIKQSYRKEITDLCKSQNIISALSLDSTRTLNDKEIKKVHEYLEEIDGAKVSDGLYTLGKPYSNDNAYNTARLMCFDPIRYSLANLDVVNGKIKEYKLKDLLFIKSRYDRKTEKIISSALKSGDASYVFKTLVSKSDLALMKKKENAVTRRQEMMSKMMEMVSEEKDSLPAFLDKDGNIIDGDVKLSEMSAMEKMRYISSLLEDDEKAKTLSGREKMEYGKKLLEKLEEEEKSGKKIKKVVSSGKPSAMERMAQAKPVGLDEDSVKMMEEERYNALISLHDAVTNVSYYCRELKKCVWYEQTSLSDAFSGKYIEPGSAGDPLVNPRAVPTGKNFYSINPETTPSAAAWNVGKSLAQDLIASELTKTGKYPEKVSFTLWSTNFISTEGSTIAEIFYLLGVEPLRDGFGYIRSLRLIPVEKLGRPRIDVVVQTSGQLRDIAASRLKLIQQAVAMAGNDKSSDNYVRKGFEDAERRLLEKGFSPVDARKYSRERIFGGANGSYGTGIMGMVEKGDSWKDSKEIAGQYVKNMSAMYSANGDAGWGEYREGVFEAALLNTSVVVQPRSSNTWGPLSLDHVYEFMGGLSCAVRNVTGNDPAAYFNDFRNTGRAKVQGLKEAIGVETNSTVFNPKYIKEMMKEKGSAMNSFAETFRNTYGWNAMKPSAIDQHIWNKYYDIYVRDSYKLSLPETFEEKNPYALQEMTAVMLESARKGMWKATPGQLRTVAKMHSSLVEKFDAGCSGFICDNAKLRDFISSKLDEGAAEVYKSKINKERQVQLDKKQSENNVVLKKEQDKSRQEDKTDKGSGDKKSNKSLYVVIIIFGLLAAWLFISKRK